MSAPELPSDFFHTFVYVNFSWFCCDRCEREPNLKWAWEGLHPDEDAAVVFTIRAVEFRKNAGWQIIDDRPFGPECAARNGTESTLQNDN